MIYQIIFIFLFLCDFIFSNIAHCNIRDIIVFLGNKIKIKIRYIEEKIEFVQIMSKDNLL